LSACKGGGCYRSLYGRRLDYWIEKSSPRGVM
jgi:hypothetical protein